MLETKKQNCQGLIEVGAAVAKHCFNDFDGDYFIVAKITSFDEAGCNVRDIDESEDFRCTWDEVCVLDQNQTVKKEKSKTVFALWRPVEMTESWTTTFYQAKLLNESKNGWDVQYPDGSQPYVPTVVSILGINCPGIITGETAKGSKAVSRGLAKQKMSAQESKAPEPIEEVAQRWVVWDPNPATKQEIQALVEAKNHQELENRLRKRIAFGTAGLRAKMQAGFSSMNELVVQQTSQGLCRYLEDTLGAEEAKRRGLVVGYDGRHNSKSFALFTCAVFLSRGHTVYLYNTTLVATPLVPFGVLTQHAAAGVMVTASHNPKQDNGFKVYWGNGAQIIPPHDRGIAASIQAHLAPWDIRMEGLEERVLADQRLSDPTAAMTDAYMSLITQKLSFTPAENPGSQVKITYTAMHGVGHVWCTEAFKRFGLPAYVPTKLQVQPDPEFPTVVFPNPEEGKGALQLAMAAADAAGSPVILANDPDADRLAVAEQTAAGWYVFNGNEIGILLASWVWDNYKKQPHADPSKAAMISTAVSSKMIAAMAKHEGFQFHDVLTGFKWIGNKALELEAAGAHVLFGYEEAIGFMIGTLNCPDKDGVRASVVMAELVNHLYRAGLTLHQHLQSLYAKYGYFCIQTKYYFCYDPAVMVNIFDRVRTGGKDGGYVTACGDFAIKHVRDQTTGFDSSEADKKTVLPVDAASQMITFTFENGCVATIRGSGTEPKLKYYVEMSGHGTKEEVEKDHAAISAAIVQCFLRPEANGLVAPGNL